MGLGPVTAVKSALAKAGLKISRHRRHRIERGVRGAGARRQQGARPRPGEGQSERRRDRARSPDRRDRLHPDRQGDVRAAAHGRALRPRHDVHRRRTGHRGDHRASVSGRRRNPPLSYEVRQAPRYNRSGGRRKGAPTASACLTFHSSSCCHRLGLLAQRRCDGRSALRRKNRKLVGLVPEQRVERFMWLVWVPLVAAGCALPYAAATRTRAFSRCPRSRVDGRLRGGALGRGRRRRRCRLVATIDCWRRMGDDWRMDIGERKTALITDGLFQRIRHPIYAFSMLLMVCSALIVPTPPMIAIALVHLTLMNVKARNEERHLAADAWRQLSTVRRSGPAGSFRGSRRAERFVAIAGPTLVAFVAGSRAWPVVRAAPAEASAIRCAAFRALRAGDRRNACSRSIRERISAGRCPRRARARPGAADHRCCRAASRSSRWSRSRNS